MGKKNPNASNGQIKTTSTASKEKIGGNYVLPATDDMTVKDLALALGIKEDEVDSLITTLADLLRVGGIKELGNATTCAAYVEPISIHRSQRPAFAVRAALCWGIIEQKPKLVIDTSS